MTTSDGARLRWRTSTRSGDSGNCVEAAARLHAPCHFGVRDSKNGPDGPQLWLDARDWDGLLGLVKGTQ